MLKRIAAWFVSSRAHAPENSAAGYAALHAKLDATGERLDAVLHKLQRRLSSKSERPHLVTAVRPSRN